MAFHRWLFFAIAHGWETAGVDAQLNEIVLGGLCTALAQSEVVLNRAALVAVAFDLSDSARAGFHELAEFVQLALAFAIERVVVKCKVNRLGHFRGRS